MSEVGTKLILNWGRGLLVSVQLSLLGSFRTLTKDLLPCWPRSRQKRQNVGFECAQCCFAASPSLLLLTAQCVQQTKFGMRLWSTRFVLNAVFAHADQ